MAGFAPGEPAPKPDKKGKPLKNAYYGKLQAAVKKKGGSAIEKTAVSNITAHRGVSAAKAKGILKSRTSKGQSVAGFESWRKKPPTMTQGPGKGAPPKPYKGKPPIGGTNPGPMKPVPGPIPPGRKPPGKGAVPLKPYKGKPPFGGINTGPMKPPVVINDQNMPRRSK